MKNFTVLLLLLLLPACAGMDAAKQYNDTELVYFGYNQDTWRIFDKPSEGRLMITPSIGNAMGEGFLRGLTLGIADTDIPKPEYQIVVEHWLVSTGRKCTVTDGYRLIRPQWEFKYKCSLKPLKPAHLTTP